MSRRDTGAMSRPGTPSASCRTRLKPSARRPARLPTTPRPEPSTTPSASASGCRKPAGSVFRAAATAARPRSDNASPSRPGPGFQPSGGAFSARPPLAAAISAEHAAPHVRRICPADSASGPAATVRRDRSQTSSFAAARSGNSEHSPLCACSMSAARVAVRLRTDSDVRPITASATSGEPSPRSPAIASAASATSSGSAPTVRRPAWARVEPSIRSPTRARASPPFAAATWRASRYVTPAANARGPPSMSARASRARSASRDPGPRPASRVGVDPRAAAAGPAGDCSRPGDCSAGCFARSCCTSAASTTTARSVDRNSCFAAPYAASTWAADRRPAGSRAFSSLATYRAPASSRYSCTACFRTTSGCSGLSTSRSASDCLYGPGSVPGFPFACSPSAALGAASSAGAAAARAATEDDPAGSRAGTSPRRSANGS